MDHDIAIDDREDDAAVARDASRDQASGRGEDGHGSDGGNSTTRSPLTKTRSMSDGGQPKLSPSPLILEASRRASKDDLSIPREASGSNPNAPGTVGPVTPRRTDFPMRGLSLQMPSDEPASPAQPSSVYIKPVPLSPKLDHSQIYASPTNILPRRSRGLDFSRAATSLHHSTLAEQSSPDSSPTMGGRAMNIPSRRSSHFGQGDSSNSLWSVMGNQERMNLSSSLGSNHNIVSDSSSTSDNDEMMEDDMDFITTPQASKSRNPLGMQSPANAAWISTHSPAITGLSSFQQRQRPRKQSRKKGRGPLGFGLGASPSLSKSPPSAMMKDNQIAHSRRESISWAANQLHISGSESDENLKSQVENVEGVIVMPGRDGQKGVIRRTVTRRGNLLPKTKGFARIRAALFEESAPVEAELKSEAEVVRQVRESDMELEPSRLGPPAGPSASTTGTAHSSPNIAPQEPLDEVTEDFMMAEPAPSGLGLPGSSFKQHVLKNSKGRTFWDTFSETSSVVGTSRTTPPPSANLRCSSSALSEDVMMDSPSMGASLGSGPSAGGLMGTFATRSNSRGETPQFPPGSGPHGTAGGAGGAGGGMGMSGGPPPPSAAEITRRINSKRRREDDFDPVSFKRRAVSPGMSVHNSPIMQSPLQRDTMAWNPGSRPGSNGGDRSSAPSESGSQGGGGTGTGGNANGGGAGQNGRLSGNSGRRIGYQGMVDTNDGIMRMSIE